MEMSTVTTTPHKVAVTEGGSASRKLSSEPTDLDDIDVAKDGRMSFSTIDDGLEGPAAVETGDSRPRPRSLSLGSSSPKRRSMTFSGTASRPIGGMTSTQRLHAGMNAPRRSSAPALLVTDDPETFSEYEFAKMERELWSNNVTVSGDFWHDTDSSHLRRHGVRSRCKRVCSDGPPERKCARCLLMWTKFAWEKLETVVFLMALGGVTILLIYGMDRLSIILETLLNEFILSTSSEFFALDTTAYMALTLCMSMLIVIVVKFIAPRAAGSGIPALISFFSGVSTPNLLGLRTLIIKVTGLVLVYATSLYVGKEGPSVHIACCLAVLLMRLPFFARFRLNQAHTYNMLAAACATGVVAAFGCPFGGMVFAVEVCATYFQVENLPRMFFVCITGSVVLYLTIYHDGSLTDPLDSLALFRTSFELSAPDPVDFGLCVLLGLICGILGGIFNNLVGLFIKTMRLIAGLTQRNPLPYGAAALSLSYIVLATVGLCNANDLWLGTYFPLLHSPAAFMENCLFSNDFQALADPVNSSRVNSSIVGSNASLEESMASQYLVELQAGCGTLAEDLTGPLLYLTLTRFLLTALSVSLPIPAGTSSELWVVLWCSCSC